MGDLDGARAALDELAATVEATGSELLMAGLAFARGVVEAAAGARQLARAQLEDAVDCFERTGLPYGAAEGRAVLAGVLRAIGEAKAAERESRRASQGFQQLGAALGARRAGSSGVGELSARELEVLRLVAEGLSDRDIAGRLVLSPHTVHRHVANILFKLGLSSRAAAAAHAARQGLL